MWRWRARTACGRSSRSSPRRRFFFRRRYWRTSASPGPGHHSRRLPRRRGWRRRTDSSAPCRRFFNRLLPETRDAFVLAHKYEREFATNPSYVHLYRKGNAYHGAHPFYMWYWGENGRQHVGKVIVAGAENNHVPEMLGWERTDTLAEAIDAGRGFAGRSAQISLVHLPPILQTDVSI